jgi:cytoplasmic iron level regulating protein YaaA (DUF328/UPF0246 family)
MRLLLPPSETKRDGGDPSRRLQLAQLSFSSLTAPRRTALAGLRAASRTISGAMAAFALGPTQRTEIDRNRAIGSAPVMAALERYTGVLFDGLGSETLSAEARRFAGEHLIIHSALFGLIGADDPIPAYRMSHDSRLPGVSLRRLWRSPVSAELSTLPGVVLDLRSDMYAALGPAPDGVWAVRVVSDDASGRRQALSHFNKKAKGEFTRAVVTAGVDHDTVDDLLAWAAGEGIRLERVRPGQLDLVV